MACQLLRVPRDKFIGRLGKLPVQKNYSWLAFYLFIPPEWIGETSLPSPQIDKLILDGQEALEQATLSGVFTRVGRTSYFAIIENSTGQFKRWLDEVFAKWRSIELEEYLLWRGAFVELPKIQDGWLEILRELEWRAYEISRQQIDNYVFQMDIGSDGKYHLCKV